MLKALAHIFAFTCFISYVYFIVKEKHHHREKYYSEDTISYYREKYMLLRDEISDIRKINVQINAQLSILTKDLRVQSLDGPPEEYEFLRRRIYSNIKEFWYFIIFELNFLENSVFESDNATDFPKIKETVGEYYRSLLNDISLLADVDHHSGWRQNTSEKLSNLIQTRLMRLQNPQNCNEARKLVCNYSTLDCGYTCRVHFHLNCFVIAYISNRTLVVVNGDGHYDHNTRVSSSTVDGHSSNWESLFLPLSDCSVTTAEVASSEIMTLDWSGNENTQVLTLDISRFINQDNPYYPFEIPQDLAPALKVLHGDPVVWWIGQFLKFILRPRPSTVKMLDDCEKLLKFQTPVVGVQISRHDKYEPHELSEYMFHVEEYYKVKELSSRIDKRRIYLVTDEPTLFEEIQLEYPDYEIIGDIEMSRIEFSQPRDFDQSFNDSIINLNFLSRCDYLVCTFSSDMGRMAYEMMNSLHPDASAHCTSLDEVFNYSHKIRRQYVVILPHQTNETEEIELKLGDLIELSKNHWNGFSSGLNLRTTMRGRFPSFKVALKMVSKNFSNHLENAN